MRTLAVLAALLALAPAVRAATPEEAALNQAAEGFFSSWFVDRDPAAAAARVSPLAADQALIPGLWIDDYKGEARPAERAEVLAGWTRYLAELLPEPKPGAPKRTLDQVMISLREPAAVRWLAARRGVVPAPIGARLLAQVPAGIADFAVGDAMNQAPALEKRLRDGATLRVVTALFRTGEAHIPCQPVVSYWARENGAWTLWGVGIVPVM